MEDGSLDLTGAGQEMAIRQRNRAYIDCMLGTAWDAPTWINDGLYIKQARTAKVLADGSIDLSGSGDRISAEHNSVSSTACVLDTGWYPPALVDGGLFVRQVYDRPVQKENGTLEVR